MRVAVRLILGACVSAILLLSSSWPFRGNPAGDWIDAAIYIGFVCFIAVQFVAAFPGILGALRGRR